MKITEFDRKWVHMARYGLILKQDRATWLGQKSIGKWPFDLKWVHMAPYELILKQEGAIWLRIILKPLLTPKVGYNKPKILHLVRNGSIWLDMGSY